MVQNRFSRNRDRSRERDAGIAVAGMFSIEPVTNPLPKWCAFDALTNRISTVVAVMVNGQHVRFESLDLQRDRQAIGSQARTKPDKDLARLNP